MVVACPVLTKLGYMVFDDRPVRQRGIVRTAVSVLRDRLTGRQGSRYGRRVDRRRRCRVLDGILRSVLRGIHRRARPTTDHDDHGASQRRRQHRAQEDAIITLLHIGIAGLGTWRQAQTAEPQATRPPAPHLVEWGHAMLFASNVPSLFTRISTFLLMVPTTLLKSISMTFP